MEIIEQSFIDESVRLELNMSDFYRLLAVSYPEDESFWNTLSGEEIHHAALIRSASELFLSERIIPKEVLSEFVNQLQQTNVAIIATIDSIRENLPSREEVFQTAFNFETSAGEIHYQRLVANTAGSVVEEIFQRLNGDDKFHARRILNYARQNRVAGWINDSNANTD